MGGTIQKTKCRQRYFFGGTLLYYIGVSYCLKNCEIGGDLGGITH